MNPLLHTVIAYISEEADGFIIGQEQKVKLAEEAISLHKLDDTGWLRERLEEIHEQNLKIDAQHKIELEIEQVCEEYKVSPPKTITSQTDFEAVLKSHKEWMDAVLDINRVGASGRANLSHLNLSHISLKDVNLRCAKFEGANLTDCDLSHSDFSFANFKGAVLRGCNLQKTIFKSAILSNADLRDVIIDDTDFSGCNLDSVLFKDKDRMKY